MSEKLFLDPEFKANQLPTTRERIVAGLKLLAVIIVASVIVFGMVTGCRDMVKGYKRSETIREAFYSNSIQTTVYSTGSQYLRVTSFDHDGHRMIVAWDISTGISMMHHPDCECGKGSK